MTHLLDRPIATGSTIFPSARAGWPEAQEEEEFYLRTVPALSERRLFVQLLPQDGNLRWLADYVQSEINRLLSLDKRWDGHRARPGTDEAAGSSISIVFSLCDEISLPPQFFPLPDGGVQIEWHVAGASVEIEVDSMGGAHALATDSVGSALIDQDLDLPDLVTLAPLRDAVRQLSLRVVRGR